MWWHINKRKIKEEHLQKNKEGKVDFHTIDVPQTRDYSRICYFKRKVTVKMLTEEIRVLRTDHKMSMLRIPQHLSEHFQKLIFSLEDRKHMKDVNSR